MVDIDEVSENVYIIDAQLYSIPKCGCVYLLNEENKALIETGPATSADTVARGIKKIGVSLQDISYVIVTHIHLDHAGGAGVLLKDMPRAQVIVHHKGVRHLIDPTMLIKGTIEVMGREQLERCGEAIPIEEHRVHGVGDGDTIRLSDRQTLKFIDAPGHAPHELCICESRNGGVFTGDAVGIYIPDGEILLPFHPPPSFNLELCINTLKRLMELDAATIYFSHFGISSKVQQTLQLAMDKVQAWDDIIAKAVEENAIDNAIEKMRAQVCAELEPIKEKLNSLYEHLISVHIPVWTAGHIKDYRERHNV